MSALARHRWPGHDVHFPDLARHLHGEYLSVSSKDLAARCRRRFGDRIQLNTKALALGPDSVTLDDGSVMKAGCVIDGRGWDPKATLPIGYQRFLGQEVQLSAPHGLTRPTIMDATIPQLGGFRFMYALPFTPDTVLLEDTIYGNDRAHDPEASRAAIGAYAAQRWGPIASVIREEQGALPIPLGGRLDQLVPSAPANVPRVGVRSGLFHATTGYSLPYAAAVADLVATRPELNSAGVAERIERLARQVWERQSFFRLLNRMLFYAAVPAERYRVLERFYRLDEGLISRFYGDRLTLFDRARLVTGRPPVPFFRGLACLPERRPRFAS